MEYYDFSGMNKIYHILQMIFSDILFWTKLSYFGKKTTQVYFYGSSSIFLLVSIGSGDGLVLTCDRPLPNPKMTMYSSLYIHWKARMSLCTWWWSSVAIDGDQLQLNYAYSISQEICTRFLLCCALLWLYIDWFSHIHQAYFTGTVAI